MEPKADPKDVEPKSGGDPKVRTQIVSVKDGPRAISLRKAKLAVLDGPDATVIINGETGTGKELVARAIHTHSNRAKAAFVVVDCGTIATNLIESELFGHEKGAFTGAVGRRAGAFESADKGTVFLDEIGELPLDLQPKLLRVLESKEIRRIGNSETKKIDVRIVAATN